MQDEAPGVGVVDPDLGAGPLAGTHGELSEVVFVEPALRARGRVDREARRGRGAQRGDAPDPARDGLNVRAADEVPQEELEGAVELRRGEEVALSPSVLEEGLVHLDLGEVRARRGVEAERLEDPKFSEVPVLAVEDGVGTLVERVRVGGQRDGESIEAHSGEPGRGGDVGRGAEAPDEARGVDLGGGPRLVAPRRDPERSHVLARRGLEELGLEPPRGPDRAGREQLRLVDPGRGATHRLEDQLDVAGGGQDRGVLRPVPQEVREVARRDPRLEAVGAAVHPVSDEGACRVLALADVHHVVDVGVELARLFARVARQEVGEGDGARVPGREVEVRAVAEEGAQGLEERVPIVGAARQGRDVDGGAGEAVGALAHRARERGVGRDLDDDVRADGPLQGLHRPCEPDGLADVSPPVCGVRALDDLARHRRDHGDAAFEPGVAQERLERFAQGRLERVHGARVERDVACEQPVGEPAALAIGDQRRKIRFRSGDDGARGRILARERDGPGPGVSLDERLDPRPVEADREHPARARPGLLEARAVVDEVDRLVEGEEAGGVRGPDLARAVADGGVGVDPPRGQDLDEAGLDEENDGLCQTALVDPGPIRAAPRVAERVSGEAPPALVDSVHDPGEDGVGAVERNPAARPLGTLAREHHGDTAPPGGDGRDGRRVGLEAPQGFEEVGTRLGRERGAHGKERGSAREVAGDRAEVLVVALQVLAKAGRDPDEGGRGAGGDRDQVSHVGGGGGRPHAARARPVLANDAVPVRSAESERVDPDRDRPVREWLALGLHPHLTAVEVDLRVRGAVARRHRGEGPALDHE